MSDVNRILHGIVDRQLNKRQFVPSKAADAALPAVLALDKLRILDVPHIAPLVFEAIQARAKAYVPGAKADLSASQRDALGDQQDFSLLSTDFYRMIRTPVAMDEAPGSLRLPPIEMDLPQLQQHIELAERKAAQTLAKAALYRDLIKQHPGWAESPAMKLGQVLDLEAQEISRAS
jgi:hypothetical protein